ncbi:MAG: wax ester/triacylglycerol synthase domain-containing protein, partial [Candidatus Sericytochromatia bacterium]
HLPIRRQPRMMATIEQLRQAPRSPLHAGDMDAAMWAIEKDPLLRQTMTAVLVLDQSPDRQILFDRMEHATRSLPPFRHKLVATPLRLSTPRWLVDPNFDLSYHVRWIRAPGDGAIEGVLEFARQSAMSGFDEARPLWTVTVVEGLQHDRAALILNISHVMTDGVGSLAVLAQMGDFTREPRDIGPMPAVPQPEDDSPFPLAAEAITYTMRRTVGFFSRSANVVARAVPGVLSRPVDTAKTVNKNVRALMRVMTPPLKSLSPLMAERRGWMRFAALELDLQTLREAAKPRGCTVNDAFVTAVAHGFALYHLRHGKPVDRLRVAIAVNIRRPGDFSIANHVRGESVAIPVGVNDPAAALAMFHDLLLAVKEEVRLPFTGALDGVLGAAGPAVAPLFGMMLKHDDFAVSNIPAGDQPVYIAGAEVTAIYPFGPLMGTAANCSLLGYDKKAFVGINVDAAAVPDLDMLARCIREGFDAVIALGEGN